MASTKVGVQLHPQATTVEALREGWRAADALGVDSIWVWDHFVPLYGDPDAAHFEAYTLLAAMAVETSHARGFEGVPSRGHCTSAAEKASCNASSARSKSPRRRMRVARIRPDSSR